MGESRIGLQRRAHEILVQGFRREAVRRPQPLHIAARRRQCARRGERRPVGEPEGAVRSRRGSLFRASRCGERLEHVAASAYRHSFRHGDTYGCDGIGREPRQGVSAGLLRGRRRCIPHGAPHGRLVGCGVDDGGPLGRGVAPESAQHRLHDMDGGVGCRIRPQQTRRRVRRADGLAAQGRPRGVCARDAYHEGYGALDVAGRYGGYRLDVEIPSQSLSRQGGVASRGEQPTSVVLLAVGAFGGCRGGTRSARGARRQLHYDS